MSERLFRGKRKDNEQMVYGYYLVLNSTEPLHIIVDHEGQYHLVAPATVGQYTGLTDKNGKKIFEGDICRNTKTDEIVSVKWHGTMAGFVWSKRKENSYNSDFGELFRAHDKYEVIGNVHDNPELLEV